MSIPGNFCRENRFMGKDYGTVEIEGELIKETTEAYLVKVGDDEFGKDAPTYWFPKARTEYTPASYHQLVSTFLIPEWLAEEKGLV